MLYKTDKFILRPFTKEDITDEYLSWFTDIDVTRYNSHGLGPLTKEQAEQFCQTIDFVHHFVWAIIADDQHIGNVSLQSINYIYRSAEFAIVVGDKKYWRKGIGYEAARLVFHHGFNRLNLHRIFTGTSSLNIGMQKLARKLGMTAEGRFKHAMFLNGRYTDIIEYGILTEKFREENKVIGEPT